MNQVILAGNVGQNPEILENPQGRYGSFSIAVNRVTGKDDATGEWKQETLWVNCRFGDTVARRVEGLKIVKGDQVFVSGELRVNKREDREYWFVQVARLEAGRRAAKSETPEPKPVAAGTQADLQAGEVISGGADDLPF